MSELVRENEKLSLFAVLLGCTPKGRNIEQHDVMFGVAGTIDELTPNMKSFWHQGLINEVAETAGKSHPEIDTAALKNELVKLFARDKVHIDAWMRVDYVDGYRVDIIPRSQAGGNNGLRLYFINLGGYKKGEFEELHRKFFMVSANMNEVVTRVKNHVFMQEYAGGTPHLDDQHKIDFEADDIICVSDTLDDTFVLQLQQADGHPENELMIGYVKLKYND